MTAYASIAEQLGFQNKWTARTWLVLSLTTIIFVIVRLPLLSEWGYWHFNVPGEGYSLLKVRGRFIAHVVTVFPWAILGSLQFVPAIRKHNIDYHRLAGKIYLLCCIAVSLSGVLMAPYSFGGSLGNQLATYIIFISFVVCFVMGYVSIKRKNIRAHKEWMMRNYAVGTSVIVIRILLPLTNIIMSRVGNYYNIISCDHIYHELGDTNTLVFFPLCKDQDRVVVKMGFDTMVNAIAGMQLGYGVIALISLLINGAVVESWIYHNNNKAIEFTAITEMKQSVEEMKNQNNEGVDNNNDNNDDNDNNNDALRGYVSLTPTQ